MIIAGDVHEKRKRDKNKDMRTIALIHSHSQHVCMAHILIFCQGLHILISIKRNNAKSQSYANESAF